MNYKPGDIIDLSRFQKPEFCKPEKIKELDQFLENYTTEVNQAHGHFLKEKDVIDMAGYNYPDTDRDLRVVAEKQAMWAKDMGQTIESAAIAREKKDPIMAEKAVTALLIKKLSERFIIARASDYDDQENGIDTVLVDKATGAIICGFDEVLGNSGDDGGNKKSEKLRKKHEQQGVNIKYGATFKDGQLIKKSFTNIPAFYLSLSKPELATLVNDFSSPKNDIVYQKLVGLLQQQYTEVSGDPKNYNAKYVANVEAFGEALAWMSKQL